MHLDFEVMEAHAALVLLRRKEAATTILMRAAMRIGRE
jgi:hypothetical protein